MTTNSRKFHTLTVILNRVKAILDEKVTGKAFWLKAEISNINVHRSGHVYLELVETKEGQVMSQCKAMIWSSSYQNIQFQLKEDSSNVLKKGNEILCHVILNFNTKYGFSIEIKEIDLNFNLGEIEKRRKETIDRLTKEGLIDLNKKLIPKVVLQNLAVIASNSTAGYQDFTKQLLKNAYRYHFELTTFSCSVQGDKAESEILVQLERCRLNKFDAIIIIRGGGSKMDLDVFNSYKISKKITEINTPVFTGIGHETDISVADLVSNKSFKTPTAVANHLVELALNFETKINTFLENIKASILTKHQNETSRIVRLAESINYISVQKCGLSRGDLHKLMNRIVSETNNTISSIKMNNKSTLLETVEYKQKLITRKEVEITNINELLHLYVIRNINNNKNWIEKIYISIEPFQPLNILNKGFVIPRVESKLYRGEKLPKDTEITLQFKDCHVIVKYNYQEKRYINGTKSRIKEFILRSSG